MRLQRHNARAARQPLTHAAAAAGGRSARSGHTGSRTNPPGTPARTARRASTRASAAPGAAAPTASSARTAAPICSATPSRRAAVARARRAAAPSTSRAASCALRPARARARRASPRRPGAGATAARTPPTGSQPRHAVHVCDQCRGGLRARGPTPPTARGRERGADAWHLQICSPDTPIMCATVENRLRLAIRLPDSALR